MLPFNYFLTPKSSFERPVPLILIDPAADADYVVCFRHEWLPYILGALSQLSMPTTWQADIGSPELLQQISRVQALKSAFMTGCQSPTTGGCVGLLPNSPKIGYAPQNPFTQPGFVPPGYINPPWHLVDASDVASHIGIAEIGDVITGWLSFPVLTPAIGQGLARFRVTVVGVSRVQIHFVQIPNGGAVLCISDDNVLTATSYELDRDLLSIPPETAEVIVAEFAFTTEGNHHVDCSFIPRFNDTPLLIGYGGGLREIVVCGENNNDCDDCGDAVIWENDMPMMRQQGCLLQIQCANGDWETVYDPTNCITDGVTQPPASGPLVSGECRTLQAVIPGNGRYLIPFKVGDGFKITVSNAQGGSHDGTFLSVNPGGWYCPNGQQYELGFCVGFGHEYSTDPLPSVEHMRLIGGYGTAFVDMFNTSYTIPVGTGDVDFWLQLNDDPLNDNSGSINLTVEVCNENSAAAQFHTYDFTVSDGGFAPDQTFVTQVPVPSWTVGTGWNAPVQTAGPGIGDNWGFIAKALSAFNLVSIEMTFDNTVVSPGSISYVGEGGYPAGRNTRITAPPTGTNVITYTPPPLTSATRLIAGISSNLSSTMHITKLVVGYTGVPPVW